MYTSLLAPCNVYRGNCSIYTKGKCSGCAKESKKAERVGRMFCDIYSYAKDKNLVSCSDCADYPCEKYDKSIFAESFIKWVREKLKER